MDLAVNYWWRAAALESLCSFINHVVAANLCDDMQHAVQSIAHGLSPLLEVCGTGQLATRSGSGVLSARKALVFHQQATAAVSYPSVTFA